MSDVYTDIFTKDDLKRLEAANRPTFLLLLGDEPKDKLPEAVQRYLNKGEEENILECSLIATRNPWYRMEKRNLPSGRSSKTDHRNWI
jgi:hypothetical protein